MKSAEAAFWARIEQDIEATGRTGDEENKESVHVVLEELEVWENSNVPIRGPCPSFCTEVDVRIRRTQWIPEKAMYVTDGGEKWETINVLNLDHPVTAIRSRLEKVCMLRRLRLPPEMRRKGYATRIAFYCLLLSRMRGLRFVFDPMMYESPVMTRIADRIFCGSLQDQPDESVPSIRIVS